MQYIIPAGPLLFALISVTILSDIQNNNRRSASTCQNLVIPSSEILDLFLGYRNMETDPDPVSITYFDCIFLIGFEPKCFKLRETTRHL